MKKVKFIFNQSLNHANKNVYTFKREGETDEIMRFDSDIFSSDIAKQVCISILKGYSLETSIYGKVMLVLVDKTSVDVSKCNNCDSIDVEVKCWKHELTGASEEISSDDEDTFCNNCGGHHGLRYERASAEGTEIFRVLT